MASRELIQEHGYALNTVDQKITKEGHVNHSDDELAFLSYYPLLRYERDPHLRALYLSSLERSWQIERPERCSLWNVIYGALAARRAIWKRAPPRFARFRSIYATGTCETARGQTFSTR